MTRNFFRLFRRRHVWKVGALITYLHENTWYYLAFRSITFPERGVQVVRGKLEHNEGLEVAVLREVAEEVQREVKIVAPLGLNYFETDTYSDCQIYYLAIPKDKILPTDVWTVVDPDQDHGVETLEWRSYPIWKAPTFLTRGQSDIIFAFRKWLRWNEGMLRKAIAS